MVAVTRSVALALFGWLGGAIAAGNAQGKGPQVDPPEWLRAVIGAEPSEFQGAVERATQGRDLDDLRALVERLQGEGKGYAGFLYLRSRFPRAFRELQDRITDAQMAIRGALPQVGHPARGQYLGQFEPEAHWPEFLRLAADQEDDPEYRRLLAHYFYVRVVLLEKEKPAWRDIYLISSGVARFRQGVAGEAGVSAGGDFLDGLDILHGAPVRFMRGGDVKQRFHQEWAKRLVLQTALVACLARTDGEEAGGFLADLAARDGTGGVDGREELRPLKRRVWVPGVEKLALREAGRLRAEGRMRVIERLYGNGGEARRSWWRTARVAYLLGCEGGEEILERIRGRVAGDGDPEVRGRLEAILRLSKAKPGRNPLDVVAMDESRALQEGRLSRQIERLQARFEGDDGAAPGDIGRAQVIWQLAVQKLVETGRIRSSIEKKAVEEMLGAPTDEGEGYVQWIFPSPIGRTVAFTVEVEDGKVRIWEFTRWTR